MAQSPISPDALKQTMKEALIETLAERGDLFAVVMVEALEDYGLVEAIKEGEQTGTVSRDQVFQQALHQVLEPVFEPDFQRHSYGFGPNRNAHQAVQQAQRNTSMYLISLP